MSVRRIACLLLLAGSAAACGDDSQSKACQDGAQPQAPARSLHQGHRRDPKSAEAYNNRCFANNELQQYDKSLIDCNTAIKLDPRNASAYNNRGVAYEMRGRVRPGAHRLQQGHRALSEVRDRVRQPRRRLLQEERQGARGRRVPARAGDRAGQRDCAQRLEAAGCALDTSVVIPVLVTGIQPPQASEQAEIAIPAQGRDDKLTPSTARRRRRCGS